MLSHLWSGDCNLYSLVWWHVNRLTIANSQFTRCPSTSDPLPTSLWNKSNQKWFENAKKSTITRLIHIHTIWTAGQMSVWAWPQGKAITYGCLLALTRTHITSVHCGGIETLAHRPDMHRGRKTKTDGETSTTEQTAKTIKLPERNRNRIVRREQFCWIESENFASSLPYFFNSNLFNDAPRIASNHGALQRNGSLNAQSAVDDDNNKITHTHTHGSKRHQIYYTIDALASDNID